MLLQTPLVLDIENVPGEHKKNQSVITQICALPNCLCKCVDVQLSQQTKHFS